MEENNENTNLIPENDISLMIITITLLIAVVLSLIAMIASNIKLRNRTKSTCEICNKFDGSLLILISLSIVLSMF